MSLDVYLVSPEPTKKVGTGIFVRDNGETRELTLEEAQIKYPGFEVQESEYESEYVYDANITHNLNTMAQEAGIYMHLWRPEEIGITKAEELIEPLREGLHLLKMDPERFKKFNPDNGWGSYEGLVKFVENYLNACYENREALIEVSR